MKSIQNKVDFAGVIVVRNANPNGDPLNGNRPRVTYDGLGEISDVCLKRKIRNRLLDAGESIFVQSDDYRKDEHQSLRKRFEAGIKESIQPNKDRGAFREAVCEKWYDVRAFGQVFAFTGSGKSKGKDGVSHGVRGPVSIHPAFSVAPIVSSSIQITKSVSNEGDGSARGSDTMGLKHRVDHGVYVFYGSISPQLATLTGFTDQDASALKKALISLFENDCSSARPDGSMQMYKLLWWVHDTANGKHSSARVHRSLKVAVKDGLSDPRSVDDYVISLEELDGLKPEVISGR